jgi:hypothetical protein
MLFSQAIRPHVPQRCIFPRYSWHDILLNINGSEFRKKSEASIEIADWSNKGIVMPELGYSGMTMYRHSGSSGIVWLTT